MVYNVHGKITFSWQNSIVIGIVIVISLSTFRLELATDLSNILHLYLKIKLFSQDWRCTSANSEFISFQATFTVHCYRLTVEWHFLNMNCNLLSSTLNHWFFFPIIFVIILHWHNLILIPEDFSPPFCTYKSHYNSIWVEGLCLSSWNCTSLETVSCQSVTEPLSQSKPALFMFIRI